MVTKSRAQELLCELIAFNTVNPMGVNESRTQTVEKPVADWLEELFRPYDVKVIRQAVSNLHENLYVEIPGDHNIQPVLFTSHMDTVSADDWIDRAFTPQVKGGVVYGRGACDDKGPLVAMLLPLLELLESNQRPPQPLVFLATGDEEHSATGMGHFVKNSNRSFALGIFGEPTRNEPIIQHKGVARWDITVHGKSAHSSQPEHGHNAIVEMTKVIQAIEAYQESLQATHDNPLVSGPRISVTMIEGGAGRNIIPEACTIAVDFRIVPGCDPGTEVLKVIEALDKLGIDIDHHQPQVLTDPVSTSPEDSCVEPILGICSDVLNHPVTPQGAPYGTDASRWPNEIPAVVIGPGDIKHAHAIDEHIILDDLMQGAEIYWRCMMTEW